MTQGHVRGDNLRSPKGLKAILLGAAIAGASVPQTACEYAGLITGAAVGVYDAEMEYNGRVDAARISAEKEKAPRIIFSCNRSEDFNGDGVYEPSEAFGVKDTFEDGERIIVQISGGYPLFDPKFILFDSEGRVLEKHERSGRFYYWGAIYNMTKEDVEKRYPNGAPRKKGSVDYLYPGKYKVVFYSEGTPVEFHNFEVVERNYSSK